MSIYTIRYSQHVRTEDEYIGQRVKVVKGRKYPNGTEYTIGAFTCWRDAYGRIQTEYAVMTTGERVNVSNLELVKPKCIHELMVKWVQTASEPCPICGARAFAWDGTGYDGPFDMNIRHSHCKNCGLDVREYDY